MRSLRLALELLIGISAILWTTPSTGVPVVAPMPDGSPASAQTLVDALLNPYAAGTLKLVAGSVAYKGAPFASGMFSNGGTNAATTIGIDSGVLLTTGDARFVSGNPVVPEDVANKNAYSTAGAVNALTGNKSPGDALFASVTSSPTFNASILSFQFIPAGDTLKMTYVFGSEDYNNWVNSGIPTDVIGIFVNGVNYAVVPSTTTPISASTVNCGGPSSGSATGANAQNCALYRDNPPFAGVIDTELNGLTVALSVTAPVVSGQINTVQIGIADASPRSTHAPEGRPTAPGSAPDPGTAASRRPAPRPTGSAGTAPCRSPSGRLSPGRGESWNQPYAAAPDHHA